MPRAKPGRRFGGRAKGTRNKVNVELAEAAREYTTKTLEQLWTIATRSKSDSKRFMKPYWGAIAIVAVVVLSSTAHANDDPAIAICEWVVTHGLKETRDVKYHRRHAVIRGSRVELTYKVVVLDKPPQVRTATCEFDRDSELWTLKQSPISDHTHCNEVLARANAFAQNKGKKEQIDLEPELQKCIAQSEADALILKKEISQTVDLIRLGIYPIEPDRTSLNASAEGAPTSAPRPASPTREVTDARVSQSKSLSSRSGTPKATFTFAQFPVAHIFHGKAAFPQFSGRDRPLRQFRTRIRKGMAAGPNFAGEYSVIQIGCGTECSKVLIASNRTGQVFSFPKGGETDGPLTVKFHVTSRLIASQWGDYETDSCFREAFLWKGTSFRSLAKDKIGPREACFNEITAE